MLMQLLTIIFPVMAGILLLLIKEKSLSGTAIRIYTGVSLIVELILIFIAIFLAPDTYFILFNLTDSINAALKFDEMGRVFAAIIGVVWVCAGFYSFEYMKHEADNKRYFGFYIIILGVLMGLCTAGNLPTYYAFYEFMTIASFALVLHNRSHEAVMAGLKYLFYSFAGAYMCLFGLYFVYRYASDPSMSFSEGGIIDIVRATSEGALKMAGTSAGGGVLTVAMLLMIVGFSVKAGMFPMHGWLPTAHPVAPASASAVLSGIIVKSGVLGIIRVIFYIFGGEMFYGSIVQKVVLVLSLVTVFIGSMLAYKEKVLKKRLAYSTVSQVSYILFGLFVVNNVALKGSIIHVGAHAAIKCTLFMFAGAIIYITGSTRVDELRGIGKKMPILLWCYTIVSLGLIGIPPFGGFVSKWYLCLGALDAGLPVFSWLGPVILMISALLTAGYLLPITINGFLPGKDFEEKVAGASETELSEGGIYHAYVSAKEPKLMMLIPIIVLTLMSVIIGLFPEVLIWG